MRKLSIFNQVLGPVMRGPSSSHTAGAFHLGRLVRDLAGGRITQVRCAFDPGGSYAHTYVQQGADRAFAMGLLGRELTEEAFFDALALAEEAGLDLAFEVRSLPRAEHPNAARIRVETAEGARLEVEGASIGGGEVELTRLEGHPIHLDGSTHVLVLEADEAVLASLEGQLGPEVERGEGFRVAHRLEPWPTDLVLPGRHWIARPVYFVQPGRGLFHSTAELLARAGGRSLGQLALDYEAELLGLAPGAVLAEALRRYRVMEGAVARGLAEDFDGMQLLPPSAGAILRAEAAGRLSLGGPTLRAGARAMAVMHVNGAMGVVCAAPTGGAAGVLPGTLVTLAEERTLGEEAIAKAFLAAGLIGVLVARRATFAAEVAGCQVEIGAAGAMAAAAVVDAVGGSAAQTCQAASIAFQNTMGSVCDPVQGMVEIPCHTRNAAGAASAFLCADLVLGGYADPVPLDETLDAVMAVGRMMPPELRCTARGGLALAPSAQALCVRPVCAGACCDHPRKERP